jgi:uncharacterized membrane protein
MTTTDRAVIGVLTLVAILGPCVGFLFGVAFGFWMRGDRR